MISQRPIERWLLILISGVFITVATSDSSLKSEEISSLFSARLTSVSGSSTASGFSTFTGLIPIDLKYEGGIMKCLLFFFLHQK